LSILLTALVATDTLKNAYPKLNTNEQALASGIDAANARIDAIVGYAGNSSAEVIDGRQGYASLRAKLAGLMLSTKDYSTVNDGATNDTVAIQSAVTANPKGVTHVPGNTVFTHPSLVLAATASLLSVGSGYLSSTGMRGNYHLQGSGDNAQAPAFAKQVKSKINTAIIPRQGFISDFDIHTIEGSAPAGKADASSHFSVLSIGDRYSPVAGDGTNLYAANIGGHYIEHRSNVAVSTAFASENAVTVYGSGSINAARGAINTAQVWDAEGMDGSQVGTRGSGSITLAVGSDSSAQVIGNKSTGTLSTAVGAQGNAYNQGLGTLSIAFGIRSQILNTGTGIITTANNYGIVNTVGPLIWVAATAYKAGDVRRKIADNGHSYKVMVAGTSGGVEPTWPTGAGATVVDGTVTWQEVTAGSIGALNGLNIPNFTPVGGMTVGEVNGLLIAAQTAGTNNRTAYVQGDLHITQGKRVILGGGGSVYDSTAKGATAAVYAETGVVYIDTSSKLKAAFFGNNGLGAQCKAIANNAAGLAGEMAIDNTGGTKYLCAWVANNTVQRVALAAF
jgi:hypothetical protein